MGTKKQLFENIQKYILDTNKINALEKAAKEEKIEVFNYSSEGVTKNDIPILCSFHDRISEALRDFLEDAFAVDIKMDRNEFRIERYNDLTDDGATMGTVFFVLTSVVFGKILIRSDIFILVALIDTFLGGNGDPEDAGDGIFELSNVEKSLAYRFSDKLCFWLNENWKLIDPDVIFTTGKIDTNSQFLSVTEQKMKCMVYTDNIIIGEYQKTGHIDICYPSASLENYAGKLKVSGVASNENDIDNVFRKRIFNSIGDVESEVSFQIGHIEIDIENIFAMKKDDEFILNGSTSDFDAFVSGVKIGSGTPIEIDGGLSAEFSSVNEGED